MNMSKCVQVWVSVVLIELHFGLASLRKMQSVNVQQPSFLVVDAKAAKLLATYGDLYLYVCYIYICCHCIHMAYVWHQWFKCNL